MQELSSMERREPSSRVRRTTFSDQERAEILKLLSTRNDRRRQLTEKQRRRETERARERRRKMTGEALLEWRKRHAENARRRRAAMLQERIKLHERVQKTLSLQQYPKSFTFTCGLCSCEFNNRWQLTQHRGKAHRQNDGQYMCEECGKTTTKVRDMIIHKRGRHNTTFCNIYSIKNNNVNQSISSKGHQESNQLSLQENQSQISNSTHYTPNSNELLSNSFHRSNFTNCLSRFTPECDNQFQPNYFFPRSTPLSVEGNEITGNSYKMLTDYIKQNEMLKYDDKLCSDIGYQPIHHFENNFDQEITNLTTSKTSSFYGNYPSFLSNDLPKTQTDNQDYKFPSHILNKDQFSYQNPTFQSESFRQNQIFQSIYDWEYRYNQDIQHYGTFDKDYSKSPSVNQSTASRPTIQKNFQNNVNGSNIKQEDNYGFKNISVGSENKQVINENSKIFSNLQPRENKDDLGTNLCDKMICNQSGLESKSIPTTDVEGTSFDCNSINIPKSQSIINNSEETKFDENKSSYIALGGNAPRTLISQVQPIMKIGSEDNNINIQSPNFSNYDEKEFINCSSKPLAIVQPSLEFTEEEESKIKLHSNEKINIYLDQQVQNTSTDSDNHVENNESQISDKSCNQNKDINVNVNASISDVTPEKNTTFERSEQDPYFCTSNYIKNQSISVGIESSDDFRNSYDIKVKQLPDCKLVHSDSFPEYWSIETNNISVQSSEKEHQPRIQDVKLLDKDTQDIISLIYPIKDLKHNSQTSPKHDLQGNIKAEINDTNNGFKNRCINRDNELNITINDFSNFHRDDVRKCSDKNAEKIKYFTDPHNSKKMCVNSSENKSLQNVLSQLDEKRESRNETICKYDKNISLNEKSMHMQITNVLYDSDNKKRITLENVYSHNTCRHSSQKDSQSTNKNEVSHESIQEQVTPTGNSDSSSNRTSEMNIWKHKIIPISSAEKETELDNSKNKEISKSASICNVFSRQSSSEVFKTLSGETTERNLSNEFPGKTNNKNVIKLIKCKGENGIPHYRISKIEQSPGGSSPNSFEARCKTEHGSSRNINSVTQNQGPNVLKEISTNEILIKCKPSHGKNESKHIPAKSKQMNSGHDISNNAGQEGQSSMQVYSDLQNKQTNMQKADSESVSLQIENKFPKMKIRKVLIKQPIETQEYNVTKLNTTRFLKPISNQAKISLTVESSNDISTIKQSNNCENQDRNAEYEMSDAKEKQSSGNEENISITLKNPELPRDIVNNIADTAQNKGLNPLGLIVVGNNNKTDITGQVEETDSEITTVFQVVKEVKPEGTFVYVCLPCELILRTNEEYDSHQVNEHAPNRIQTQEKRMEIQLKKHGNDIYVCKKCTTVFKTRKALLKHNRYKHNAAEAEKRKLSRVKNHVCGVCGRKFVFGHLLQDHINTHTGDTPYTCMVCGTRHSMRSELMCHVKLHRQPYV